MAWYDSVKIDEIDIDLLRRELKHIGNGLLVDHYKSTKKYVEDLRDLTDESFYASPAIMQTAALNEYKRSLTEFETAKLILTNRDIDLKEIEFISSNKTWGHWYHG